MGYATEFSNAPLGRLKGEGLTAQMLKKHLVPIVRRKERFETEWNVLILEYSPDPDKITLHDMFCKFESETLLVADFWQVVVRHVRGGDGLVI